MKTINLNCIKKEGLWKILLLFLCLSFITVSAFAQTRVIKGKVTDQAGEALISVSVIVKGTTTGTLTDENGNYLINAGQGATLTVSYIGYLTQEIAVGQRSVVDITLVENARLLDEVIVVSYGTQKKRDVTGAIKTVNASSLADFPVGQIAQKLQGQVAGVQINQSSGIPGQGMAFRIRGAASINNSSQPLFVVDGLPISTGLNNINPDDIETFSILKDASATSLYGSRAANGVVLITTKKGKEGRMEVSFNANYGVQTLSGQREMDVMNANEFAHFKKEYYEDKAKYEKYTDGVPEMYQNPDQYGKGTDWYRELIRSSSPIQNYNLNLSGGNERYNSVISFGYFKQEGIVRNSSFERISLRSNNEYKVNNRVRIGLNVAPIIQMYDNQDTDGDRAILSASLLADPCLSPYDKDGNLTIALQSPGMFGQPNWIRFLDERLNTTRVYTLLSNAFAEVDIWDGLKYRLQAGLDIGNQRQRIWASSVSGGGLFTPPPVKANSYYKTKTYYNWTVENMLSYDKTFGEHTVGGLLGYSAQKYSGENGDIEGTDFADDDISWIKAAATTKGSAEITEWTVASIIARANYSFRDKYLLQATIRRDGSSRFGTGNKYANFPSVSAGWIMSEESFMAPVERTMNYSKLRASYGVTGNYNIGDYSYIAKMSKNDYILGGVLAPGQSLENIGNNQLTWEETKQLDIGIDLGFLNDRIFFVYDYYSKKTNGLLYQTNIPWSSGFGSISSNIGQFDSWGHEITVESRNLVGKFSWKTSLNLTFNRNEVRALSTNNTPIGGNAVQADWNRLEVGQPIGVFKGFVYDGVYMTQREFDSQPKHATSDVGTVRMKDVSGPDGVPDGIIDLNDRTIIGDPNPDMFFGITNEFAWKNFDMSILLSGQIGGDIFLGAYENTLNLDGVFNVLKDVQNRWRSLDNPGDGRIPRTKSGTTDLYRYTHSGWVYDATYLTLRNITLGYTIPIKANQYLSKARVYFSAQQLFTLTSYPGLNPEINNNGGLSWNGLGVDRTATPIPKTFTIGCNITF